MKPLVCFSSVWSGEMSEPVGFSHEQMTGLVRVKALSERGASQQAAPWDKRQAFIRWLCLQGRLQSEEPLSDGLP